MTDDEIRDLFDREWPGLTLRQLAEKAGISVEEFKRILMEGEE